mmetsp:Transcript_39598/g.90937  ORF Transcript_39598/g.90937 Transcript_39598/m.90937 type:complete len:219 (+) Transcript_39598:252-908(+)
MLCVRGAARASCILHQECMTPDLPSVTLVALILAFCRLVSEQGLADLLRDVSKLDVKEIWYQGEAKALDQYGVDEKVHARCHVSLGRHLIVIFACEALNRFLRYISKLIIIFASKIFYHGLGEVAKFVILLANVLSNPVRSAPLNLSDNVTKLVVAVASELQYTRLNTRVDFARKVTHLVVIFTTEISNCSRCMSGLMHLDGEDSRARRQNSGRDATC